MKEHSTIPKCHRPKPLYIATSTPTTTSELSSKFVAEYETMFFQQLERAIIHNTITLEINSIRQETIVLEIEKLLIISEENPAVIKRYYNDFMNTNNIPVNHHTLPELRKIINLASVNLTVNNQINDNTSTTNLRKRKLTSPQPPSKKQPKTNHFLAMGSPHQHKKT